MRFRKQIAAIGCLILGCAASGCNSSPSTANRGQDSSLDNYQPQQIQRLGDDTKDFHPDGFMQGFNGAPEP